MVASTERMCRCCEPIDQFVFKALNSTNDMRFLLQLENYFFILAALFLKRYTHNESVAFRRRDFSRGQISHASGFANDINL